MDKSELSHHGILGQKWGVRRYQNPDGTRTEAGKKRYSKDGSDSDEKKKLDKETKKKIVYASIGAATLAVAAHYIHKNPEKIGKAIAKVKDVKISDIESKAVEKGKEYVKSVVKGAKEGFEEGLKEGPKKAGKAIAGGAILLAAKKGLDSVVGKEESAKIFQANDNKKIGKFWKTSDEDKDDSG